MTTNILEALIQLFALFAAGHDKKGVELGRSHAARYMRVQLPKARADESLMRFDELVDQFQRISGWDELKAKRFASLMSNSCERAPKSTKDLNGTKSMWSWSG